MRPGLSALDLAFREMNSKSANTPRTPRATPGRVPLYDEAELRRARRQYVKAQTVADEAVARNAPKIDRQSELLSRERLRRDCKGILEEWRMTDGEGQVLYEGFFRAVERVVDFTLVSEDLEDLSIDEKEVLCDRIWSFVGGKEDSMDDSEMRRPIALNMFLDAVVKLQYGELVGMEESEPKEIGKVGCRDAFPLLRTEESRIL